jgi:hypothetical protein
MKLAEAVVALREPRFAWYFAARTTTTIGSAMTTVALAFAVLHISNDPAALAQVLAAHMTTMVLFLLLGGGGGRPIFAGRSSCRPRTR